MGLCRVGPFFLNTDAPKQLLHDWFKSYTSEERWITSTCGIQDRITIQWLYGCVLYYNLVLNMWILQEIWVSTGGSSTNKASFKK